MVNYYDVLGVQPSASRDEIRAAYKQLALRWHPDRNAQDASAEERFKRINEAYQVLSDAPKKDAYDLKRYYHATPQPTYAAPDPEPPPQAPSPPRRAYGGRPRYAPRVTYSPDQELRMKILVTVFFALLIGGGVVFYRFMNRYSAREAYQAALLEGRSFGAMLKFSEAISFDGEYWQAYYQRGTLRLDVLGDYKNALADFNAALRYAPNPPADLYYYRGLCYYSLRRYPDALADMEKTLRLNARQGSAYYFRGLSYWRLGQPARACRDFGTARQLGVTYSEDSLRQWCN